MTGPVVLSPKDTALIQNLIDEQNAIITACDKQIKDINEVQIPKINEEEKTNKKLYYKFDDMIVAYEMEMKWLNGVYITNPISESDLTQIQEGRLWANQATELIRIPEFDGGGAMSALADYYIWRIDNCTPILNRLTNGLTTSVALTVTTQTAIIPSSTTVTIGTDVYALVNKEFIVHASVAGQSFIALCTSVTDNSIPGDPGTPPLIPPTPPTPATEWYIHFTFISTFVGTIPVGAQLTGTWTGFNNTERTNKVSTIPFLNARQTVLLYYVLQLQNNLTAAIGFLNNEIVAINTNYDPNLGTVIPIVQAEITFYTNYLTTTDVSDTGVSTLTSNNSTNKTRATTRVTTCSTKKAAYYDKRYFWAVERSGSGGTIVQRWRLDMAITSATDRKTKAQTKLAQLKAGVV